MNKKLISGAGLLFAATLIVNIANYGLNLFLARFLGPSGFAEANILATLVMLLSFIAMGIQLTVSKLVAEEKEEQLNDLLSTIRNYSIVIAIVLGLLTMSISEFLQFRTSIPLFIIWIGIPFYLLMSGWRGYFQGALEFKSMALTYLLEMVVRLGVTLSLIMLFQGSGLDSEIVALGFLLSFVATHLVFRQPSRLTLKVSLSSQFKSFFIIMMVYELSQILINNSDVILVKHYFSDIEAGIYAAIALIGRAVFFATWTVVTILFPSVIEKRKKGESTTSLFGFALMVVMVVSAVLVLGSYLFGEPMIRLIFGEDYMMHADKLWLYAMLTTLFACANVFVYYNLSLEKYTPVLLSIIAGCLQIVGIYFWHETVQQVLIVQLVSMSLLFLSMLVYQFIFPLFQQQINYTQLPKLNAVK